VVERVLGKDEVKGSIPLTSFVGIWYSAPYSAASEAGRNWSVPNIECCV
jgi:hypothetical protein